jgi:hypothetical protein
MSVNLIVHPRGMFLSIEHFPYQTDPKLRQGNPFGGSQRTSMFLPMALLVSSTRSSLAMLDTLFIDYESPKAVMEL